MTRTGRCPGNAEHDQEIGWDIRPVPPGLADDLYPTLDQAWQTLAETMAP